MNNFHQGGKYTAQIASHQTELRREETLTDQKYLYISSLQTYYLNIEINSWSCINNERANLVQEKCTFCGGTNDPTEDFSKI